MRAPEDAYPDEPVQDLELEAVLGRFYLLREKYTIEFAMAKQAAALGRNDRCPCGSGDKVKKCHGGLAGEQFGTRFRQSTSALSHSPADWLHYGDPHRYPASWTRTPGALTMLASLASMSMWGGGGYGRSRV